MAKHETEWGEPGQPAEGGPLPDEVGSAKPATDTKTQKPQKRSAARKRSDRRKRR